MENAALTSPEIGPNFEWRRKPRNFWQLRHDASKRLMATWRPMVLLFFIGYLIPLGLLAALVGLAGLDLQSRWLNQILWCCDILVFLLTSLGINVLAWGRFPTRSSMARLFSHIRTAIPRILILGILGLILTKFYWAILAHDSSFTFALTFFVMGELLLVTRLLWTPLVIQFEKWHLPEAIRRTWQMTSNRMKVIAFGRILSMLLSYAILLTIILRITFAAVQLVDPTLLKIGMSPTPTIVSWFTLQLIVIFTFGLTSIPFQYFLVEAYIDLRVRRGEWTAPQQSEPTAVASNVAE
jgi:hypothetical protein